MRKVFFIFIILFATNIYSQEYKFDKFIIYEQQNYFMKYKRNILVYINTENPSYYIVAYDWGREMHIYLTDKKQRMMHSFTTDSFKSSSNFKYFNSYALKSSNFNDACKFFSIYEENIDSTHTKLITTLYSNKKKTKIQCIYETFIEPFEYDGLDNFLQMLQSRYVPSEKIQTSQKSIPNLIKDGSEKIINIETKLKKIESIDIIINVDLKKIILKK